ncbi:hypothetical protein FGB62_346g02 [Gracilaria domingensis]|nr:hypothetical protein FGB62_346g02 [Gracilaria domingensis]
MAMMDDRLEQNVAQLIDDVLVYSTGFSDTTYGTVLTTEAALGLPKLKQEQSDVAKEISKLRAGEGDEQELLEKNQPKLSRK